MLGQWPNCLQCLGFKIRIRSSVKEAFRSFAILRSSSISIPKNGHVPSQGFDSLVMFNLNLRSDWHALYAC